MCGIIAVINQNPMSSNTVLSGLQTLQHRGPDGYGTWTSEDKTIQLGHQRLAIVDPKHGAQPMSNEDGSIIVVVNGEIYDDHSIRTSLKKRGHQFSSYCDSEVLLHLYAEQGLDCLASLNGEFAFILWDSRKRRLIAVRDRFGIKPLFYSQQGNQLLFASEAKALLAMGVPNLWDEKSLLHSFSHQYLPPQRSLFKNIQQVSPGKVLIYEKGKIRNQRWWSLNSPVTGTGDLRARLSRAVNRRLRSDVAVAVALSGGIDSASIAALVAERQTETHCFSVCFDEPPYDESKTAQEVARHIGATWYRVSVSQHAIVDQFSAAVKASECLAINGQLSAKHLLNQAVRQAGFSVILTGEGADECLLGYPHFYQDANMQVNNAEMCRGIMLAENTAINLIDIKNYYGYVPAFLAAKIAIGQRISPFLSTEGIRTIAQLNPVITFLQACQDENNPKDHKVQRSADLWTQTCLADYILRALGDGSEMASSVEGRPPFLDHEVFSWLRSQPVTTRLSPGIDKKLLRSAVADLLPQSVLLKNKQPFLAPPITRYGDKYTQTFIMDTLSCKSAQSLPFVDISRVIKWANRLPDKSVIEQQSAEPALMLILSAIFLQQAYGLTI